MDSVCSCGTSAVNLASGACGSVTVEESALSCKWSVWPLNESHLCNHAECHVIVRQRQNAGSAPSVSLGQISPVVSVGGGRKAAGPAAQICGALSAEVACTAEMF